MCMCNLVFGKNTIIKVAVNVCGITVSIYVYKKKMYFQIDNILKSDNESKYAQNAGNAISDTHNSKKFRGGMPPDPPSTLGPGGPRGNIYFWV
jgi:hypothetical protein